MGAVIQLVGRMLLWLVSTYAGQWVLKILVTLGLTVAVKEIGLPALMSFIQAKANGLPAFYFQVFGAMGFDVMISMIVSACVAVATGRVALRAVANA